MLRFKESRIICVLFHSITPIMKDPSCAFELPPSTSTCIMRSESFPKPARLLLASPAGTRYEFPLSENSSASPSVTSTVGFLPFLPQLASLCELSTSEDGSKLSPVTYLYRSLAVFPGRGRGGGALLPLLRSNPCCTYGHVDCCLICKAWQKLHCPFGTIYIL